MDRHIAKVWELDFPSPTHKFVILCVARLSIRSGLCFAKQKTIAADTGFHFKTVQRTLADLEELGFLRRQGFLKADGTRGSDRIWLTLPEVILSADEPEDANPLAEGQHFEKGSRVSEEGRAASPTMSRSVPKDAADDSSKSQGVNSGIEGEDARETRELAQIASAGIDIDMAVEVIWRGVGDNGRRRSSKAKVKKALAAALSRRPRGADAEEHLKRILSGVRAYLAHADTRKEGGRFEHGAHRTLQDDVWESFLDDAQSRAAQGDRSAPDPDLGSADTPGPALQRYWMENERQGLPWHFDRGPRPGMPGCRVDPALQREFGYEPYPEAGDDDASAFL